MSKLTRSINLRRIKNICYIKEAIIILFGQIGMYDKVEEEYEKIENIVNNHPNPFKLLITCYNRSLDYRKQGKHDKEYEFLEKARQSKAYREKLDI